VVSIISARDIASISASGGEIRSEPEQVEGRVSVLIRQLGKFSAMLHRRQL
jgi:hypothetical protein